MLSHAMRYDLQRYEKKLYQSPKSFQQSAFFPQLHYNGLKRTSICHKKETAASLQAAVSRLTCRHSPQSYSSRGCSPAEPRYASDCAAKIQIFFHSAILQFDLL